ncbi:MAG: hypothetical protein EPO21_15085 [Chloroflexota bacterium]|nr:MAG: hypothetical protein EPO21_15085 [Chloroflexota bacterium]
MAKSALFQLSFHEPRRLRLPPQPLSTGATLQDLRAALFDDSTSQYYCQRWWQEIGASYVQVMTDLAAQGVTFQLSMTDWLMRNLLKQRQKVARSFFKLLRHPNVEWVTVDPYHSLTFYLDIEAFGRQWAKARALTRVRLSVDSDVVAAPHLCLNNEIYWSAAAAGFRVVLGDGAESVLGVRSPGYLHRNGEGPYLCVRNAPLSLKAAGLLAAAPPHSYNVQFSSIAEGITDQPGPIAVLGWRVPNVSSGSSPMDGDGPALLRQLAESLLDGQISFVRLRDLLDGDGDACRPLPLPTTPAPAAEFGDISYFLGHPTQQSLFRLMQQSYSIASLSKNQEIVEMAMELAQWDVLELVHRLLISGGACQEPSYLSPTQWNALGRDGVLWALHQTYETFVRVVSDSLL